MDKKMITAKLVEKHHAFIRYIESLTTADYLFRYEQKWTAAEQLAHIVLCTAPLVKVFCADKEMIAQNFGHAKQPGMTSKALQEYYTEKLKQGGKAPERYVPERGIPEAKDILITDLQKMIKTLCTAIGSFSEAELDTLCIPHPLLGTLTLREILYNTIHHVEHHKAQIRQHLAFNTVVPENLN